MDCPCKDCKERHECCHDKCEKYKSWKHWLKECKMRDKEDRQKLFIFIKSLYYNKFSKKGKSFK